MTAPLRGADEPRPVDYPVIVAQIISYLHEVGVAKDPYGDQVDDGELCPIFYGNIPQEPDRAIGVIGPWQNNNDSDTLPVYRFMVVHRSRPHDLPGFDNDAKLLHRALQRPDHTFNLTAEYRAAYCYRVVVDPPTQDNTGRWIRITTYEMRVMPPTLTT